MDLQLSDNPTEVEFQALVDALVSKYPTVESKGFDLAKIKGSLNRRTAKALVLQLYLHGNSISDIATAVGVTPATVADNLEQAIAEAAPLDDVETLRALSLQRLGYYRKLLLEEFERSGKPKTTKTFPGSKPDTVADEPTLKIEDRDRNPAYMRLLIEIEKREAALKGMDQPTKVSVTKDSRQVVLVKHIVDTREQALAAQEHVRQLQLPKPEK